MYLSQIKLWNFRQFGSDIFNLAEPNLSLNFKNGLNVLIGKNDSGKSAIIDAIKLVLKTHSIEWITPHKDDFYKDSTKFRIELRFDGFSDDGEEAKYFTEWLSWEGEGENAKVFLQVIYEAEITDKLLAPDVKAGLDGVGYPLTAEARDQLKVTYLRPLRDAANELIPRKDSRLSKIFYGHEAFRGRETDHDLVSNLADFCTAIEKYFVDDASGKAMKDTISDYIKSFCDDSKEIGLSSDGRGNLRGILEKLELSVINEKNLGLGTQNRLFMASELLHLEKTNWQGLRLGLIEELEAHLHPQAQMKVVESLQKRENIQLILTTHSPNLASKVKLENLIICHNANAFPLGENYTELEKDDYKFLEKFLDVTKSNLFFAKGVIFIEGWAEEIILPTLAKKLGFDLTKCGVSIVNVAGIGFLNYSKIFLRKDGQELDLPVSIITDSDVREYETTPKLNDDGRPQKNDKGKIVYDCVKLEESEIRKATDERIAKKRTDFDKQKVKSFFAPSWTLEYSLLKSEGLSNSFKEVVKRIHSGTNWDENFEKKLATKLLNESLKKTEIAYQLAQKLDDLETLTIEETDSIYYLVEAIKYACRN